MRKSQRIQNPRSRPHNRPTHRSVSNALRQLARTSKGFDAARYFRAGERLRFYNVGTPQVRAVVRSIHDETRHHWTVDDAVRFADDLIQDSYLETKAVGIEVLARYRRAFAPRLLMTCKRWLAQGYAANWATTDALCGVVIGPLLADYPVLIPQLHEWARHRNLWVRRAAAVALIPPIRRGLALETAYHVAETLQADDEDLIQKATGWMLREAGKQDRARLERYLRAHGRHTPRTTVRYAIERFPEVQRRELLQQTRESSASSSAMASMRRRNRADNRSE